MNAFASRIRSSFVALVTVALCGAMGRLAAQGGPVLTLAQAVDQALLRGLGPSTARRSLTGAELRRADADRQQTVAEQQLAVEVASAYYRVVAQQAFVEVARQSLERARSLRDASEAKLDAGLVSQ